jgi:succinate dehydrogenase/fumarate reductase-like Fe-S protein
MKKTIWYMHKPGEERDYAMTTSPSIEWAQKQHAAGFKLYEIEVYVPTLLPIVGTLKGYATAATDQSVEFASTCVTLECPGCPATIGEHHSLDCQVEKQFQAERGMLG